MEFVATVPTKLGAMKLSKISWYAEELKVPFTGTKGLRTPEEQTHTTIPPSPLAQCLLASAVLLSTTKPKLVHLQFSTATLWCSFNKLWSNVDFIHELPYSLQEGYHFISHFVEACNVQLI